MTTNVPRQLRLIIETDDFDEALQFYRDVLGMPEQAAFATDGEDRVAILHAGTATLELASPAHARAIDEVENAPSTDGPTLRIALEVQDTEKAVAAAGEHGAELLAPPTRTPFRTINARVQGPGAGGVAGDVRPGARDARGARGEGRVHDRRSAPAVRAGPRGPAASRCQAELVSPTWPSITICTARRAAASGGTASAPPIVPIRDPFRDRLHGDCRVKTCSN